MSRNNGHPTEPVASEDRIAEFLAAFDDALARGTEASLVLPGDLNPAELAEVEQLTGKLRVLRDFSDTSAGGYDGTRTEALDRRTDDRGETTSPLAPSTAVFDLPKALGRFEIVRELGSGGCGIVLLARDPTLDRHVAVKIPRLEAFFSRDLQERFVREAQAAARLRHPNVVAVHEAGQVGKLFYIASAYCAGPNLAVWLREQRAPVPASVAANIVAQLADAIDYAHAQGVHHRDLKPSNVLLEPVRSSAESVTGDANGALEFTPQITDFGLAKLISEETTQTRTGTLLGTLPYLPPEQIDTRRGQPGATADVYGLGAILYEVLTGAPPFAGQNDAELLHQILVDDPTAPRKLRADVPRDLQAICSKCLEKDPRRRYQSAAALARDLRRWLRGEPTEARPVTTIGSCIRWARRKPLAAALALVMLVAATIVVAVSVRSSIVTAEAARVANAERLAAEQHRREADDHRALAEEHRAEAERQREVLRRQLHAADMPLAYKAYELNNIEQLHEILARHVPASGQEDLRGFAWHYLDALAHGEHMILRGHDKDVFTVLYSPDGKYLATCGKDATVRLWDATDGKPLVTLSGHTGEVNQIVFSPDGSRLASAGDDGAVRVWETTSAIKYATEGDVVFQSDVPVRTVAFSPDGETLAVGHVNHAIELIPLDAASERRSLALEGEPSLILYSPVGEHLFVAIEDHICQFDVASGRLLAETKHRKKITMLALSHDGKQLVSDMIGEICCWNGETLEELPGWERQVYRVDGLAFSPDDRLLAICGRGAEISIWDVETRKRWQVFRGHTGWIWSAAFSPDGSSLATSSADGTVRIWKLPTANPIRFRRSTDSGYTCVNFSPDSQTLTAGTFDGKIEMWNWRLQRLIRTMGRRPPVPADAARRGDAVWAVAFSPDRSRLAASFNQGVIQVYDSASGELDAQFLGSAPPAPSLSFSPDQRFLAAAVVHPSGDATAQIWRIARREALPQNWRLTATNWMRYLDSAPYLAAYTAVGRTLRLLDAGDLSLKHYIEFRVDLGTGIDVSADGCLAAAGGGNVDRALYLWDVPTGECLASFVGHEGGIVAVAFCPDRRTIASASDDGTVRLWDIATRQELLAFELHETRIANDSLVFSPDGQALAVVAVPPGGQREIVVWQTGAYQLGSHKIRPEKSSDKSAAHTLSRATIVEPAIDGAEGGLYAQSRNYQHHANQADGAVGLCTFEQRTRNGVLEFCGLRLRADSEAELWTGVFPPLNPIGSGDTRALFRVANSETNLPGGAAAAYVLGGADGAFPKSWTMILLPPSVVERRDLPADEVVPTNEVCERFRHVDRWAKAHGYTGGFPTYIDVEKNGDMHYGAVLIKTGIGEEAWYPVAHSPK